MAGIVAYVSVSGLLKVFTGAGTMGLMFFGAIEIGKIIATSAIHTYGKQISRLYKILLGLMVGIAMLITSIGVYGFLSSSYKESFAKMVSVDSQVELLESKRDGYQDQLVFVSEEKTTLNKTISELSSGLANNVIQYRDRETGQIITTTSSSTRRALEKQLDNAIVRQTTINTKADSLTTIIFDLENEILETKLGNDAANELGTLKYLSDVTGKSMDVVMSWFIILLIVIGDPLAVLLVIVFNKVANKRKDDVSNDATNDATNVAFSLMDIPISGGFSGSTMEYVNEEIIEEETPALVFDEERVNEVIEEVENTPEEQIEENIEDVKQLKREPIIPRGKIIEEDLKKDRGFSVEIPDPQITRIGSNKEVVANEPTKVWFKRKRSDELSNE